VYCDFYFEEIVGGVFGSGIWVVLEMFCKGEGEGWRGKQVLDTAIFCSYGFC
jgi:hypothetical protein